MNGCFKMKPPSVEQIQSNPSPRESVNRIRVVLKSDKLVDGCTSTRNEVSLPALRLESLGRFPGCSKLHAKGINPFASHLVHPSATVLASALTGYWGRSVAEKHIQPFSWLVVVVRTPLMKGHSVYCCVWHQAPSTARGKYLFCIAILEESSQRAVAFDQLLGT